MSQSTGALGRGWGYLGNIQDYFSCRFSFSYMLKAHHSLGSITNQGAHCFSPQAPLKRSPARRRTHHVLHTARLGSLLSSFPARGSHSARSHLPHQSGTFLHGQTGKWPRVAMSLQTPKHARLPDGSSGASLAPTLSWVTPLKGRLGLEPERVLHCSSPPPLGYCGPSARSCNPSSL